MINLYTLFSVIILLGTNLNTVLSIDNNFKVDKAERIDPFTEPSIANSLDIQVNAADASNLTSSKIPKFKQQSYVASYLENKKDGSISPTILNQSNYIETSQANKSEAVSIAHNDTVELAGREPSPVRNRYSYSQTTPNRGNGLVNAVDDQLPGQNKNFEQYKFVPIKSRIKVFNYQVSTRGNNKEVDDANIPRARLLPKTEHILPLYETITRKKNNMEMDNSKGSANIDNKINIGKPLNNYRIPSARNHQTTVDKHPMSFQLDRIIPMITTHLIPEFKHDGTVDYKAVFEFLSDSNDFGLNMNSLCVNHYPERYPSRMKGSYDKRMFQFLAKKTLPLAKDMKSTLLPNKIESHEKREPQIAQNTLRKLINNVVFVAIGPAACTFTKMPYEFKPGVENEVVLECTPIHQVHGERVPNCRKHDSEIRLVVKSNNQNNYAVKVFSIQDKASKNEFSQVQVAKHSSENKQNSQLSTFADDKSQQMMIVELTKKRRNDPQLMKVAIQHLQPESVVAKSPTVRCASLLDPFRSNKYLNSPDTSIPKHIHFVRN